MDKALVDKMLAAMVPRTAVKGEFIARRGEPRKEMVIVESGLLTKVFAKDEEEVVDQELTVSLGDIVGLLHFYSQDPTNSDLVVASDEAKLLSLTTEKFKALLAEDVSLQSAYITMLSRRLRKEMAVIRKLSLIIDEDDDGAAVLRSKKFKLAFFDRKGYFKDAFEEVVKRENMGGWLEVSWFDDRLAPNTATLADGHQGVCCFVNDDLGPTTLAKLAELGVGLVALRCAGYDRLDVPTAKALNISVTRVPAYSPSAVAEFAVTLLMALNRRIHKAADRVSAFNFSLEGLVGFDLRGKTVAIFGTGKIGVLTAQIFMGFGCKILACDIYENAELKAQGAKYVDKKELLSNCDVLSIHAPLTKGTKHWLDKEALALMKPSAVVINTSRGPLIDTEALLEALLAEKLAGAAMDVIEGEADFFYKDNSFVVSVANSTIARLIACPNVILTGHQAFLTREALDNIATSTLASIKEYHIDAKRGDQLTNIVKEQY